MTTTTITVSAPEQVETFLIGAMTTPVSFGELADWRPASTAVEQRIACLTVIAMLESALRMGEHGINPAGFIEDAIVEAKRLRDLLEAGK